MLFIHVRPRPLQFAFHRNVSSKSFNVTFRDFVARSPRFSLTTFIGRFYLRVREMKLLLCTNRIYKYNTFIKPANVISEAIVLSQRRQWLLLVCIAYTQHNRIQLSRQYISESRLVQMLHLVRIHK